MIARDLAIDLGTSNTLVYQQGRGVVFDEPSVVALNLRTGRVLAVGREALRITVDGPATVVVHRPLQRGAITDFEVAAQMLRLIVRRVGTRRPKPRALVCVASMLTPVERRAVEEAVAAAGTRSIALIEAPLAAAIGAGLPVQGAMGNMVVDVGGGTSEMAMLALGGMVRSTAIPVGGLDMDAAIQEHLSRKYDLAVGESTAERIKIQVGSAYPAADADEVEVSGRDLETGRRVQLGVSSEEVREVLAEAVGAIVQATRDCLSESPPELAHDVLETGLFLTGGGGLLRGLEMRLARECEVPVHLTDDPRTAVVRGAGRLLEFLPEYREAFLVSQR